MTINNWNSASGPGYQTGTNGILAIATSDNTESKFATQSYAGGDGGSKFGIRASASGAGNTNYGVYGSAFGATTNWAGYFDGNMYLSGAFMPGNMAGNSGEILTSQGSGNPPVWQTSTNAFGSNFIQNQAGVDQSASFRINGTGSLLGNLGIGTSSPAVNTMVTKQLTVAGSSTYSSSSAGLNLVGSSTASFGGVSRLTAYNIDASNVLIPLSEIYTQTNGGASLGKFVISLNNGSSLQQRMIIDQNGRTMFQSANNSATLSNILHVYESVNNTTGIDGSFINIHNGANTAGASSPPTIMTGLRFKNTNWAANANFKGGIFFQTLSTRTKGVGNMIFAVSNDDATDSNVSASDAVMTLTPAGNVGIGNTNPLNKLAVVGDDNNSNTTTTGGIINAQNQTTTGGVGIMGRVSLNNSTGIGNRTGVSGIGWYGQSANYGIYGYGFGGTTSYGIYATAGGATTNYAGYFSGNVHVTGTLSKSGGTFKIDDPRDPENKYLSHSFIESPDMMNIYNGNVTTNSNNIAIVELPAYFDILNKDFRYQLTVIGDFSQAIVYEKISGNKFTIKTDKPNIEVSWQVTGIRKDPWAEKNRVIPEQEKPSNEKGTYLNPELYGQPVERGMGYPNPNVTEGN